VPDDLAPADLTVEKALELLSQKAAPAESLGTDPASGRRLLLKFNQGHYLELERTPEEIEAKLKPTWISLPPGVDPKSLTEADIAFLTSLPREIGVAEGTPVLFKMGKYGAYVERAAERRTIEDWRLGESMTLEDALERLAQPKFASARAPAAPLKEFGELPGAAGPVKVMAGRFGPYVTDGEGNATLPRTLDPASLDPQMALDLLQKKRDAGPSPKRAFKRKKAAPAKKSAAKKK
jgi:DNA topoisomerase-1